MIHSRRELLVRNAVYGSTYLARWLSATQKSHAWWDLYCGEGHVADALEACWNTIAEFPDSRQYSDYRQAAHRVGLAEYRGTWKPKLILKVKPLEDTRLARNSRHGSFDDNIPEESVLWVIGHLLTVFDLAVGKPLELEVSQEAWRTIMNRPGAAANVVNWISANLAPQRLIAGQEYIDCPLCNYRTFDSSRGHCRICLHKEATFLCTGHNGASLYINSKWYLLNRHSQERIQVCTACFQAFAQNRTRDLRGEPYIIQCRVCNNPCFDLYSSRCLLCGIEDRIWMRLQMLQLGLGRCQTCTKIVTASSYASTCLACRLSHAADELSYYDVDEEYELDYEYADEYELDDELYWDEYEEETQCLRCGDTLAIFDSYADGQFCVSCEAETAAYDTIMAEAQRLASEMMNKKNRGNRIRGRARVIRFISRDIASAMATERSKLSSHASAS